MRAALQPFDLNQMNSWQCFSLGFGTAGLSHMGLSARRVVSVQPAQLGCDNILWTTTEHEFGPAEGGKVKICVLDYGRFVSS